MSNDLISRSDVLRVLETVFYEYKMSFGEHYGGFAEAIPKAIESIPAACDIDKVEELSETIQNLESDLSDISIVLERMKNVVTQITNGNECSAEQNFYFTFGSSKHYPYQNGYIIVIAESLKIAIAKFREKYPDVNENSLNCSDYYTQKQWNRVALGRGRNGVAEPKEILR